MKLNAFGYSKRKVNKHGRLEMSEVTFVANSKDLRRLAAFLTKCADECDSLGAKFSHGHLQDESDMEPWPDENVDVIVAPSHTNS